MENINIEESGGNRGGRGRGRRIRRGRHGWRRYGVARRVAPTQGLEVPGLSRSVFNELHSAAIAFVRDAVMAALPPDQSQFRRMQNREQSRPEEQSLPGHLNAILQELNGVVFRSLENNLPRALHDVVQQAVLEALEPDQGQARPMQN